MSYSTAHSAYSTASQFITPIRAIVLLYDRAVQAMLAAREAILAGNVEDRFLHTQKAGQIVTALQGNLDFERGGEISPMLNDFYNTLFNKIQQVNLRNDQTVCDDVILALSTMQSTWENVASKMDGQPVAASGTTPRQPLDPGLESAALSV